MIMSKSFTALLCVFALCGVVREACGDGSKGGLHFFISTGDNQMNHEIVPFDSAATIDAGFEAMASFGSKRAYWRGEQEDTALKEYLGRPENHFYYSYWLWLDYLINQVGANHLAVKAAHRNGMEIYMEEGLFEHGAQGEAGGCAILPYQCEDALRLKHPEWIPVDRWGERQAPGPVEYAYPGARKAFVTHVLHHIKEYDGVLFYTYVENEGFRYPEEFGFNKPIVDEFKRRYGVDIRTQPFDKDAWYKLRGEYVTQLFRELHKELSARGKKLSIIVWGEQPSIPMGWQRYTTWTSVGYIHMDVERWISEGIVDEIVVFHYNEAYVSKLLALSKGKPLSIVALGAPTVAQREAGVTPMTDVWAAYGLRFSPEGVSAQDIRSPSWQKRTQVLSDMAGGAIPIDARSVEDAVSDPNVMVRRQAIRLLPSLKNQRYAPLLEKALDDPENTVRATAASALASLHGPASAERLLSAVRKHKTFQLRNTAVRALKAILLTADGHNEELVLLKAHDDDSVSVREVVMRALEATHSPESERVLLSHLINDKNEGVRYWAISSLTGRGPAVGACMAAMKDSSIMVQMAGVRALGKVGPSTDKLLTKDYLEKLEEFFIAYGDKCKRSDASWGWRVAGNALLGFGDEGKVFLEKARTQSEDKWLSWAAYQVLYVPQNALAPVLTDEKTAVETHERYAPPFPGWRNDKPHRLRR